MLLQDLTRLLKAPRGRIQSAVGRLGLLSAERDLPVEIRVLWLGAQEGIRLVRVRGMGHLEDAEAQELGQQSGLSKWLWLKEPGDFLVYCETDPELERAVALYRRVAIQVPEARILESWAREERVDPRDYELLASATGEDGGPVEALALFLQIPPEEWQARRAAREAFRSGLSAFARLWQEKTGEPLVDEALLSLYRFLRELEVARVLDEPLADVEPEARRVFHVEGEPDMQVLLYPAEEGGRLLWAGLDPDATP